MSLDNHLEELRKKHKQLSDQIEEMTRGRSVDQTQITEQKKKKLRLKEQITRLEGGFKDSPVEPEQAPPVESMTTPEETSDAKRAA